MLTYHPQPSKTMRILHVVHQYPPEHTGGTEYYTQWLTQALQRRQHQVSIFHRTSGKSSGLAQRDEAGVTVWSAWDGSMTPNGRFRSTFSNPHLNQAFSQILAQTQPQLIHLQHLMGLPVGIARQIDRAGLPYVVTLHDYWYGCANAQLITNYDNTLCSGPSRWLNCAHCALARAGKPDIVLARPLIAPLLAARHYLLRRVLEKAAVLIAPSTFVKQQYAALGLPTGHMQVVRHGIELPDETNQQLLHGKRPYADPPLQISYIGGLSWQKGVHLLVTAVNQLPATEAQLIIYGDPEPFPEYVATLKQSIAQNNIQFGGKLARQDLWQALAKTDVLVVPSVWYETSSLIIQEAQAAGVPVIASNIGAIPEKVTDGVDGLLFAANDSQALYNSLLSLLQQPEKLNEMRDNIQPVRSISNHVDEIEGIYETAVRQSARAIPKS
ncbi:hypothetical protein MNBD_CHLOROFLEXI01-4759 [hydrothermal vent metagenome]|uniref:Glycosyltransferase n=1 Tax=hydrothermal vent metagenome TaxID=652676 RepID=A0A3B0WHG0_9ZZZZ